MTMFFYLAIWKQNWAQYILLPKYPVNHVGNNDDSLVSVGTGAPDLFGTWFSETQWKGESLCLRRRSGARFRAQFHLWVYRRKGLAGPGRCILPRRFKSLGLCFLKGWAEWR